MIDVVYVQIGRVVRIHENWDLWLTDTDEEYHVSYRSLLSGKMQFDDPIMVNIVLHGFAH